MHSLDGATRLLRGRAVRPHDFNTPLDDGTITRRDKHLAVLVGNVNAECGVSQWLASGEARVYLVPPADARLAELPAQIHRASAPFAWEVH